MERKFKLIKCCPERFKKPDHLSTFLADEERKKKEAIEEAIASVICIIIMTALYFAWSKYS